MQYLAWRVLSGLNESIEISFLLVGRTKFAPDWCFGLLKQLFRKSLVGCLNDLVRVVNQSAETNHAQLVGEEDGTVLVHQYDWATFFAPYFRRSAFDGIKSWHHLVFSSTAPGQCEVRVYSDLEETTSIKLLSKEHAGWEPDSDTLPPVINPPGLPRERRKYLFEKIREFVPEAHRDTVCPDPCTVASPSPSPPSSPAPLPSPSTPSPSSSPSPPPTKRQRRQSRQ